MQATATKDQLPQMKKTNKISYYKNTDWTS